MERVLSYGDVLLRRHDLMLLHPPNFLNDHIIDFHFAQLNSRRPGAAACLAVSPSTSFWIIHCPDARDLAAAAAPLDLARRDLLLFPINNSTNLDYCSAQGDLESGTHWSVLAFHRPSNACLHFDSAGGANEGFARSLHARLADLVDRDPPPRFLAAATPQQENGYDCGAYVMAIASALAAGLESARGAEDLEALVTRDVTADSVARLRRTTLDLIRGLALQQQQESNRDSIH